MEQCDPKRIGGFVPVALVAVGLACCAASGCGGASRASSGPADRGATTTATSTAVGTLPQPETQNDPDLDSDTYPGEPDNDENHVFGHVANAADRRAAMALLRRYFEAAKTGDGAAACRLMYSSMSESMVEDYGSLGGSPYMRASTCAGVMSGLFKHLHARLAAEAATFAVAEVRVRRRYASVRMGFGGGLARFYLELQRERGRWRLDRILPTEQAIYVE